MRRRTKLLLRAILLVVLVVVIWFYLSGDGCGWEINTQWDVSVGIFSENQLFFDEDVLTYSQKFEKAVGMIDDIELTDHVVIVDISEQKEYIFTGDGVFIGRYKVSTGSTDMFPAQDELECDEDDEDCEVEYISREMGPSVWRVRSKFDGPFSPFYGERVMMLDRWIGYSWVGTSVALHGTDRPDLLGTPWSLGCVYHKNADIIELYKLLETGDLVVAID